MTVEEKRLCRLSRMRSSDGFIIWDGARLNEKRVEVLERHRIARMYCAQCGAIEQCEADVRRAERARKHIDGVVAGRYPVMPRPGDPHAMTQSDCRLCGAPLIEALSRAATRPGNSRHHRGEGLCDKCFPVASMTMRIPGGL